MLKQKNDLKQSSAATKHDTKGFKEEHNATNVKFPAQGREKKKASWVVGG